MTQNRGKLPVVHVHSLVKQIQQFPQASVSERVQIFHAFERLVHSRVRIYLHPGTADYEDCLQEGFVGLFIAVEKFDTTRGTRFSTFAATVIDRRIIDYLSAQWKHPPNALGSERNFEDGDEKA